MAIIFTKPQLSIPLNFSEKLLWGLFLSMCNFLPSSSTVSSVPKRSQFLFRVLRCREDSQSRIHLHCTVVSHETMTYRWISVRFVCTIYMYYIYYYIMVVCVPMALCNDYQQWQIQVFHWMKCCTTLRHCTSFY